MSDCTPSGALPPPQQPCARDLDRASAALQDTLDGLRLNAGELLERDAAEEAAELLGISISLETVMRWIDAHAVKAEREEHAARFEGAQL